jgi:hypothetical protein
VLGCEQRWASTLEVGRMLDIDLIPFTGDQEREEFSSKAITAGTFGG